MNKAMRDALTPVADKIAFADRVLTLAIKFGLVVSPSAKPARAKAAKAKPAKRKPRKARKPRAATPVPPAVPRLDDTNELP